MNLLFLGTSVDVPTKSRNVAGVAMRETSVLFAVLISTIILKQGFGGDELTSV
jgi:ribonuclease BN (tRNA processing enzyme)